MIKIIIKLVFFLNNYKIKIIIKFSDELNQDNWYLTVNYKDLSHLYH